MNLHRIVVAALLWCSCSVASAVRYELFPITFPVTERQTVHPYMIGEYTVSGYVETEDVTGELSSHDGDVTDARLTLSGPITGEYVYDPVKDGRDIFGPTFSGPATGLRFDTWINVRFSTDDLPDCQRCVAFHYFNSEAVLSIPIPAGRTLATTDYDTLKPTAVNESLALPGDHNFDGVVDAADYSAWRHRPDDYEELGGLTSWQNNYGRRLLPSNALPVPSPSAATLASLLLLAASRSPIVARLSKS